MIAGDDPKRSPTRSNVSARCDGASRVCPDPIFPCFIWNTTLAAFLQVELADRSYPISIAAGLSENLAPVLSEVLATPTGTIAIVSDSQVAPLYGARVEDQFRALGLTPFRTTIPAGEASKSIGVVDRLWRWLADHDAGRDTLVVALGGGVVGDVAGFVAATYMRGIRCVQIPTSLLAQVDSSVGGKTGINLPQGKNLVGAFWQPVAVWIDPDVLKTLDPRQYRSGCAEVIKYGVIMDADFFRQLEQQSLQIRNLDAPTLESVIARCCQLKAEVVRADERETSGRREILNYGHTFGHAIESATDYGMVLHGEAIAIGMTMAVETARRLGHLEDPQLPLRQASLLQQTGLPICVTDIADLAQRIDVDSLLDRMLLDKKNRRGRLRLVLPRRLGQVDIVADPPLEQVRDAIRACWNRPPE